MQNLVSPIIEPDEGRAIWNEILKEAKAENLTATTIGHTTIRLMLLSALFAAVILAAWTLKTSVLLGLSLVALSILLSQFAFLGHNAGHATISRNSLLNQAFGQYAMTFITGMCFDAWFKTHRAHHQYCQNEEKDPDMEVNLLVSLSERSCRNKSAVGRWFTRFQPYHIWFLSFFFAHSQRHLTQLDAFKWRSYVDGLVYVPHLLLWFVLPYFILDIPLIRVALVYFIPFFILGPHLASVFWINHIGMPTIESQMKFSFLEHQALTSRTVRVPKGMAWLFGGLDLQIEHHILPQVPSFKLQRLQKIVERSFHAHAIPYRAYGWWETIVAIQRHLQRISQIARTSDKDRALTSIYSEAKTPR